MYKTKDLKAIWSKLLSGYTDNDKRIDELWVEIENSYSTKKRHYHNLAHLSYMIDKAIKYKSQLKDLDTVLFSIFYHDIVYNTKRGDNEQKSADIAHDRLTKLGVPTAKITKCQHQIMATKNHEDNRDNDTNFLVDFDLAVLGDTFEVYRDYARKIRDEYSVYPDFLYRKGRKKVLQHFLTMDRIFKTDEFHENYELQARENLSAELEGL